MGQQTRTLVSPHHKPKHNSKIERIPWDLSQDLREPKSRRQQGLPQAPAPLPTNASHTTLALQNQAVRPLPQLRTPSIDDPPTTTVPSNEIVLRWMAHVFMQEHELGDLRPRYQEDP
jgi:hypothetical protein